MLTKTLATPPTELDVLPVSPALPAFPSPDLVHAAAGLFTTERVPERVGSLRPSVEFAAKWNDYYGDRMLSTARRSLVEGVRWRVEVGPGVVAVRSFDPARAERSHQRSERAARLNADLHAAALVAGEEFTEAPASRSVQFWSGKSRARMVQRLSELDFTPMFDQGGKPADLTLTLPGDWQAVAPDAGTCHKYLLALRKRFERATGRRLHAIWKREFQGRGAPHWHLFTVLPGTIAGEPVREWFGRVWSEVVGSSTDCQGWETCANNESRGSHKCGCSERALHRAAGVAVDFTEGARRSDPRRLAAYFSKHGSFKAKDYQNTPPAEWAGEPVGRFWGYWHLSRAVAAVEVAPDVATAVSRAARRYAAAHRFYVPAEVWRKVTTVDRETGEIGFRWRKRRSAVPVLRFRTAAGFLVVNDGPAFAAALARVVETSVHSRPARRSAYGGRRLLGPAGFLP